MAKPAHIRATWSGVFGSPGAIVEHWSFSLSLQDNQLMATGDDDALDDYAADARTAYADHLAAEMGNDIVLTETRIAAIDGAGLTRRRDDGSLIQGIDLTTVQGAKAAQPVPLQQALCVSLTSARNDATGKGRFYLPWPSWGLNVVARTLPADEAPTLAAVVRDFVAQVDNGTPSNVVVVSSKGYVSPVTGVKLGRAPDTMRSRRADVPESYVALPLHP